LHIDSINDLREVYLKRLIACFTIALLLLSFCVASICRSEEEKMSAMLEKGIGQYKHENYDEALVILGKAREENPQSSLAAYYLGLTHKQLQNYDEAIANFVKKQYNLIIGERMAETIKITVGDAMPSFAEATGGKGGQSSDKSESRNLPAGKAGLIADSSSSMEIRGRDAISGLPRIVNLSKAEVTTAITPVLHHIVSAIKSVLEETPPELAADIIDKGIVMAGGTSLLANFDKLVTQMTGVPAHVADEPLLCVVRGTGVAIENIELYKRSISKK